MLTVELLHKYRVQNLKKYIEKYGDRTPEEVIASIETPNETVEPQEEAILPESEAVSEPVEDLEVKEETNE